MLLRLTFRTFQRDTMEALGIPQHKLITRTKRLGGAFGGKEIQSLQFVIIAAAAAQK